MKIFKILATICLLSHTQYVHSEAGPIKIGASLALSGNLSFIGTAQQKGFELAKEEINKNGGIKGRPLEVISEDNTGDATQALTGVKKLILSDKADIIFSSFTHITQAIKTEVKQSEKLLLYQSTLTSIANESPTFFKDYADSFSGGEMIGRTSNNKNYKNISIFSEQNDACNEVVKGIKSTLNTSTRIVSEGIFNHGDTDLKPSLIKIKSKKPDALLTCTWRDSALLMPQLKSLGMLKTLPFNI
jgi:branched-chain amino acid transport system substrate-binding protein